MEKKQIKRNRREIPDFKRIRELQKKYGISDYELAIAAGYGGASPVSNLANAERVGYWASGKSKKLHDRFAWNMNEILHNTQSTVINLQPNEVKDKETPKCDCVSSAQSAMFLGQLNEQMLVLNHMIYRLCESLDVKLNIKVRGFTKERSVS